MLQDNSLCYKDYYNRFASKYKFILSNSGKINTFLYSCPPYAGKPVKISRKNRDGLGKHTQLEADGVVGGQVVVAADALKIFVSRSAARNCS